MLRREPRKRVSNFNSLGGASLHLMKLLEVVATTLAALSLSWSLSLLLAPKDWQFYDVTADPAWAGEPVKMFTHLSRLDPAVLYLIEGGQISGCLFVRCQREITDNSLKQLAPLARDYSEKWWSGQWDRSIAFFVALATFYAILHPQVIAWWSRRGAPVQARGKETNPTSTS